MSPEQRADARRLADELEIFGAFRPEVRATVGALLRSLAEQPEAAQSDPLSDELIGAIALTDAEISELIPNTEFIDDGVDQWNYPYKKEVVDVALLHDFARAIERRVRGGAR